MTHGLKSIHNRRKFEIFVKFTILILVWCKHPSPLHTHPSIQHIVHKINWYLMFLMPAWSFVTTLSLAFVPLFFFFICLVFWIAKCMEVSVKICSARKNNIILNQRKCLLVWNRIHIMNFVPWEHKFGVCCVFCTFSLMFLFIPHVCALTYRIVYLRLFRILRVVNKKKCEIWLWFDSFAQYFFLLFFAMFRCNI